MRCAIAARATRSAIAGRSARERSSLGSSPRSTRPATAATVPTKALTVIARLFLPRDIEDGYVEGALVRRGGHRRQREREHDGDEDQETLGAIAHERLPPFLLLERGRQARPEGVDGDAVGAHDLVHLDLLSELVLESDRELVHVPRAGVPRARARGHEAHDEGAKRSRVDRQLLAADLTAVGELPGHHFALFLMRVVRASSAIFNRPRTLIAHTSFGVVRI